MLHITDTESVVVVVCMHVRMLRASKDYVDTTNWFTCLLAHDKTVSTTVQLQTDTPPQHSTAQHTTSYSRSRCVSVCMHVRTHRGAAAQVWERMVLLPRLQRRLARVV